MKASELKPFDVLRHSETGELGLVVEIAGDKVCLADKDGQKAYFNPGGDRYVFVPREEGGSFALAVLARLRALRREAKPRRKTAAVPRLAPRKNARRR